MWPSKFIWILLVIFPLSGLLSQKDDFQTPFEKNTNTSSTYQECLDFYKKLELNYPQLQVSEAGETDSGWPLHTVVLSKDRDFDPVSLHQKEKCIVFIINGIHPGEPDGIDASMMLARDCLQSEERMELLEKVVFVIIPVYNVGGALNRGSHSRANQNGPEQYGFRGNDKNFDLNRDFIKCDSREARSFNRIFNHWKPDILVDNHTTNGADYPYTMTLLATQKDKLETPLAEYMEQTLLPGLYADMDRRGWEMCPYVHARDTPDKGIIGFLDVPRFSTGYGALHHTIGFTVETHMLKPFPDRVWATYHFMDALLRIAHEDAQKIHMVRENAILAARNKQSFDVHWVLDSDKADQLLFKGYEAKYKPSKVTGQDRLYYDRDAPYEKEVPFFNTYKADLTITKPAAYLIPQAYREVIDRLRWNGVEMKRLKSDATIDATFYYITGYESSRSPVEGHYLHHSVKVETKAMQQLFRRGDYVVTTDQAANRYLVETLEPQATDSYFAWNFFDGILMQKEYFSDYVFEDLAAELLRKDKQLKADFEKKKSEDPAFAKDAERQLEYIYKRSPYYEPTHMRYPVARLMTLKGLEME